MPHSLSATRRVLLVLVLLLATVAVQPPRPAEATTWSYCSAGVCQVLDYSGTTVNYWRTQGYSGSSYSCHTAKFWVNGGLYDTEYKCGTNWITEYGPAPRTWSSGTQLCASWSGISGMVCKNM